MPLPAVAPPDVVLWATGYFRAALAARPELYADDVFVSDAVPSTRRARMVVIESDGGPKLDVVRIVQRLRFQVWAGSWQETTNLALLVYGLVVACPGGSTPVLAVTGVNGPFRVADPSGDPKSFLNAELLVRGSDL